MGLSCGHDARAHRRFMLWMLTVVRRRTDRIVLAHSHRDHDSPCGSRHGCRRQFSPGGILKAAAVSPPEQFRRALMIGIVWGAFIGGTANACRLRGFNVPPCSTSATWLLIWMFPLPSGWRWASPAPRSWSPRLALGSHGSWKLPPEFREIPSSSSKASARRTQLPRWPGTPREIRTAVVLTMVTL